MQVCWVLSEDEAKSVQGEGHFPPLMRLLVKSIAVTITRFVEDNYFTNTLLKMRQ